MWSELRFAVHTIKKHIQNSAELRTSFAMSIVGMMLNNLSFILLWAFFVQSVGVINGWTIPDIIGLNGFLSLTFGLMFSVMGGMRKLPIYVSSGAFDRFLLSPKNILLTVSTSAFVAPAVGDCFFGVSALAMYAYLIDASMYQVILMVFLAIFATITFFSVGLAVYSTSFFFTDGKTVSSSLFEIFLTPATFHGGLFQGAMRFGFTFLVPALVVGALPIEIIRDVSVNGLIVVALISIAWLCIGLAVFGAGIKKYESANLMTFGR